MATENFKKNSSKKQPRSGPKPATQERLQKAAIFYLERYATSAENLKRVLMRRVDRSAQLHQTDRNQGAAWVEELITRYRKAGLLDDVAYATTRAVSLHRQGKSARAIRQTLAIKGVGSDDIDAAFEALVEEVGAKGDLPAAINYARRRRIGPWRTGERDTFRDRDLAALGRQGFSYDIARKVIEADSVEMLEDQLETL